MLEGLLYGHLKEKYEQESTIWIPSYILNPKNGELLLCPIKKNHNTCTRFGYVSIKI